MMTEKDLFDKLVKRHSDGVEAEVKGVRAAQDLEYVHRMRVSLRRLKTTLSDFKELLPARDYDAILFPVNKLLRALGSARDIDTKISFLKELLDDPKASRYREGIAEIIDEFCEDRSEAQPKILKNLARVHQRRTFHVIRKLAPSLDETGITIDEWAKNRIIARLEKMFTLEPYVRRPGCVKELHEMRIATKNLRYTLENLQTLYGRRIRVYAMAAMKVQKTLGEVHSYDVWTGLMKNLSDSYGREPSFRRAVTFLRKECEQRREKSYKDFVKLWASLKRKKNMGKAQFLCP